jgi:hypothetical protein
MYKPARKLSHIGAVHRQFATATNIHVRKSSCKFCQSVHHVVEKIAELLNFIVYLFSYVINIYY